MIAALRELPAGEHLFALSHLLCVDRRGPPEGRQSGYSTLEKEALLRAITRCADNCDERVIVSEVNWPLHGTSIWSPIGCTYEIPEWRENQPGESEDDYANYKLRYLAITLCSGHVDRVFWWRLSAHGYDLVDDRDDFRPRPAFHALAFFLTLLGATTFVGKWQTPPGAHALVFDAAAGRVLMAWTESGQSAPLPSGRFMQFFDRGGSVLTQPVLHGAPLYALVDDAPQSSADGTCDTTRDVL